MISYLYNTLKNTIFQKHYWQTIFLILNRTYKHEYGSSFLGNIWMLIKPFILITVYAIVFSKIAKFPNISNYPFFLTINIILWLFISGSISASTSAISSRGSIIKYCPISKTNFIIVDLIKLLKIYLISLFIIYIIIGLFFSIELHKTIILFPVYLLLLIATLFSLSVALAYLYPYFRDLGTLIEASLPALMWLSPIVYPAGAITGKLGLILKFSPFSIMINPFTKILFYGQVPSLFDNIAFVTLFLTITLIALIIHKKLSKNIVYYI